MMKKKIRVTSEIFRKIVINAFCPTTVCDPKTKITGHTIHQETDCLHESANFIQLHMYMIPAQIINVRGKKVELMAETCICYDYSLICSCDRPELR